MLFSNASNFATAQQDELNFYNTTILPECDTIAETLNDQLLNKLGYQLEFEPQSMDLFQEDEEQRAQAFSMYIGAGMRPSIFGEALGIELPMGVEYSALDEKYDKGLEMSDNLALIQPGKDEDEEDEEEDNEPIPPEKTLQEIDLEKWERKALKRLQRHQEPFCAFSSDNIPLVLSGAIEGALETAQTADDVKAVFSNVWITYP